MEKKFEFNPFTGKLDWVIASLAHTALSDMPDVAGTIADHDGRYYTKTEIDTAIADYLKKDGSTTGATTQVQEFTNDIKVPEVDTSKIKYFVNGETRDLIDVENNILHDNLGNVSVWWLQRELRDIAGNIVFDWQEHKMPYFTSNGFLKTSGGDGTLGIDTSTYLTTVALSDLTDIDLTDIANLKILQYNSSTSKWECETLASGVSFGTDNQIPYTNVGSNDFDYSANLTFDGTTLIANTVSDGIASLTGGVLSGSTIADATEMNTSGAPIADAGIANKKYVDDNAGSSVTFGTDNQIPYTNSATDDFDYGEIDYTSPIHRITAVDPEQRLTDTGNDEYTRVTKSDTDNVAQRLNKVNVLGITITGGTKTTSGNYTIHTFNSNDSFKTTGHIDIEVLVVAGGGAGGGSPYGGGGGAGGLLYNASMDIIANTYAITVGNGGAGVEASVGQSGANSVFSTMTAIGGGGGGKFNTNANNGGSGGGEGFGSSTYGTGTAGQGNDGGTAPGLSGAGGGGAGAVGSNGTSSKGGNGGVGLEYSNFSSIGGSTAGWFAGGGGGSVYQVSNTPGYGGNGGGGDGSAGAGIDGVTNTGGGGGGSERSGGNQIGGDGGSGIVAIRYLTADVETGTQETSVWKSEDGTGVGETGIQTFGDATGKTILAGNDIHIPVDSQNLYFGVADDASITYDGTNLLINPKAVGSGYLQIDGDIDAGVNDIQTTGSVKGVHKTADGTSAVADGTYVMGLGITTNGTITIKDGIITSITEAVD